jgi:hypothetical protein
VRPRRHRAGRRLRSAHAHSHEHSAAQESRLSSRTRCLSERVSVSSGPAQAKTTINDLRQRASTLGRLAQPLAGRPAAERRTDTGWRGAARTDTCLGGRKSAERFDRPRPIFVLADRSDCARVRTESSESEPAGGIAAPGGGLGRDVYTSGSGGSNNADQQHNGGPAAASKGPPRVAKAASTYRGHHLSSRPWPPNPAPGRCAQLVCACVWLKCSRPLSGCGARKAAGRR